MPYADPQTRRDRRRDYMRELMRERRAPMVKARARKLLRLFTDGANAPERGAARLRLIETAESAGVPVGDLMAAIGAPLDVLDVPHA